MLYVLELPMFIDDLENNQKNFVVLGAGIEPAHSEEYRILSPVRLPIPPPKHEKKDNINYIQRTNAEN